MRFVVNYAEIMWPVCRRGHQVYCSCGLKACPHLFPKQENLYPETETLYPETGYFVSVFGNKIPVSEYKVSVSAHNLSCFGIQIILLRKQVWTGHKSCLIFGLGTDPILAYYSFCFSWCCGPLKFNFSRPSSSEDQDYQAKAPSFQSD